MKYLLSILLLVITSNVYSQELRVEGNRIYQNDKKLSNKEIKSLYASTPLALENYSEYRSKSSVGGFCLGFGLGLVISDLGYGLTSAVGYPTAFTYVGLATSILSIPILSGRKKILKKSVDVYNEKLKATGSASEVEFNFSANANGFGLKLEF